MFKQITLIAALAASFTIGTVNDAHAIKHGSKRGIISAPPPNGNCTPCLNGCEDFVCKTPPDDVEDMPVAALKAEKAGYQCLVDYSSLNRVAGDCGIYAWLCDNGVCDDSFGWQWADRYYEQIDIAEFVAVNPETRDLDDQFCALTSIKGVGACCDLVGDCGWAVYPDDGTYVRAEQDTAFEVDGLIVAAGSGWHAIDTGETFAYCVGSECTAVDTRFGCSYWEGDDILVCMLTTLNDLCGGCIEPVSDEDE